MLFSEEWPKSRGKKGEEEDEDEDDDDEEAEQALNPESLVALAAAALPANPALALHLGVRASDWAGGDCPLLGVLDRMLRRRGCGLGCGSPTGLSCTPSCRRQLRRHQQRSAATRTTTSTREVVFLDSPPAWTEDRGFCWLLAAARLLRIAPSLDVVAGGGARSVIIIYD